MVMGKLRRGFSRFGFLASRAAQQLAEAWRDGRQVAEQNGVSRLRILRDLLVLNVTQSLGVRPYFQYRLYRPDLSAEDKRRYLPDTPWANARLWTRLNPRRYGCLYTNKVIFNRFFSSLKLPVARIFGVYDPVVGRTESGERLRDSHDLREWLPRVAGNGFVFKAVEGVRGHSILVFTGQSDHNPNLFVTLSGDSYDASALVAFAHNTGELKQHRPEANRTSFLIEERIRPHPKLAEFVGPTLCTARMQTIIGVDGTARIVAAVFKLQPKPIGVDQLIYGAVGCWVDLETGVLVRGRTRESLQDTTVIPGTATPFVGFQLPDWPEMKALALRAAEAFPWARSIGWDIAPSEQGPVLIEGNEEWSPSLIQIPAPYGLMTGEFERVYRSLR
jgi:hypothetical protein